MTNFNNKVALVTGSVRGIGRAIAVRYASLGASLIVNYSTDENALRRPWQKLNVRAPSQSRFGQTYRK
jgi:3-oxoacyl-[acyl-carrier protein] reductase